MTSCIGYYVKIAYSSSTFALLEGSVIEDTKSTLVLLSPEGKRTRVPKKGNVFQFKVDERIVTVDGAAILDRPSDRLKKRFKSW